MSNNQQEIGLIGHKDNPFLQQIIDMGGKVKTTSRKVNGNVASEKVTVTFERNYLPFNFTKIFQNKKLLSDLDPWACKLFIYIALNLQYEAQTIDLSYKRVGLTEPKYREAMMELMLKGIIAKKHKGVYWVNVTVLIVGNIGKHESI